MKTFEGYYFKHQRGDLFLAAIVGRSDREAFVQLVTQERAYYVPYPREAFAREGIVRVGGNRFSRDGAVFEIEAPEITLSGSLSYGRLTPLGSDIMGPFRLLPMQCRHRVLSMRHELAGAVTLNGRVLDFNGGTGYVEGDEGRAFPSGYLWLHCSDFDEPLSVMVSVAEIPVFGRSFTGCIAAVVYRGREYRLATYRGVRVLSRSAERIELTQGKYRLIVEPAPGAGHGLRAPANGRMDRTITERPAIFASFRLYADGKPVFRKTSLRASFEYAYADAAPCTQVEES